MKKNNYKINFINHIINKDFEKNKKIKVRTRFPPEPNGYLHLGHAKSICLNFGIAKHYNGTCNLRLDDTNPEKENKKYVESIKNDVKWLGFKWHGKEHYASEYFNKIYQYAIELIKKGLAYVDRMSKKEIKIYRGTLNTKGKNSIYRTQSVKENLFLFKQMRKGRFKEGSMCLRAKINMSSSYIIMRDPVLYRIKFVRHHKTEKKWCIFPMYDLTHCISDAIEKITHSLCTLEFENNRCLYNWILKNININFYPKQYEFSKLNLEYNILSKRKIKKIIEKKIIKGWDDPRIMTIIGLKRRGYTASSIREFCKRIGVSKKNNLIEICALETCISEELNKNANRIMAILNPIKIIIENLHKDYKENILLKNHPKNINMGTRRAIFSKEIYIDKKDFCEHSYPGYKRLSLGKEVRLRYAYIIKATKIEKDNKGNIKNIFCVCDLNTLGKNPTDRKIKGVIHWISALNAIKAKFNLYNHLFLIKNPELEKNFLNFVNPKSLVIQYGLIEKWSKKIKPGSNYQFEREGYFSADYKEFTSKNLVFNRIIKLNK
ncbi:glutamine--tRNA ligase [Buchnera aphidicola (Neophyllaphis podocarpi)]|uniref:glutamine--tRNA ligase n=1 Tax=Buchnera aphidicola TaxID=9 RepID=UPI0031B86A28